MSATNPISPQRVLIPLGMGTAISLLGDNTLYTVLPRLEIAAQAGVTLAMVGVLLGVNRAVRLLFNGTAGVLYDRLSRRWLLIAALSLGALSTLVLSVSKGFMPLLLARVMWGAAWSGIWVGGNTVVLDISNDDNRGRLSGQYQMWFFLGAGISALLGGVFTDVFGFHRGLLVSGGLTGLGALMWLFLLPETRPARTAAVNEDGQPATDPFPWGLALRAAIPMFTIRFVLSGVMMSTTILWLTGFIGDELRLASFVLPIATLTGMFGAFRAMISLVGAPLSGYFSDLAGRRWPVLAAVLAVGMVGAWLMGATLPALALLGAVIAYTSGSGVQALTPAIIGDRTGKAQRGRALSVIYTMGDLGSALGPPLALALIGVVPIGALYRLCAGLMAAMVGFALWQTPREKI